MPKAATVTWQAAPPRPRSRCPRSSRGSCPGWPWLLRCVAMTEAWEKGRQLGHSTGRFDDWFHGDCSLRWWFVWWGYFSWDRRFFMGLNGPMLLIVLHWNVGWMGGSWNWGTPRNHWFSRVKHGPTQFFVSFILFRSREMSGTWFKDAMCLGFLKLYKIMGFWGLLKFGAPKTIWIPKHEQCPVMWFWAPHSKTTILKNFWGPRKFQKRGSYNSDWGTGNTRRETCSFPWNMWFFP